MRTKFYLMMFLLLGGVSISMAQSHEKTLQIHFESDEFGLDKQDRDELKKLIQELGNSSYHEITITGHTDHDASEEYNQQLSNRRAQQVRTFLGENGIQENRISMNWYGENKPKASNAKETGKKENRRVEIKVKLYDFKSTADVINQISETKTQVIEINPKIENKVEGEKGLEITIPANSLETEDGQAISPGPVKIELTEIYSDRNAIEKQISTTSEGQILETGGMFEVKATQNGKNLKLKSGKSMAIEMPSNNLKEGMNVFVAEKNSSGITEWKITPSTFNVEAKAKIKIPFTKVNSKLFLAGRKPEKFMKLKNISFIYKLPPPPVQPIIPAAPKKYPLPPKSIYNTYFERFYVNKEKLEKRYNAEVKRREKLYQEKLNKYNKNLSRYIADIEKYKRDSINYETAEYHKFKTWLNAQKENCRYNIDILETNAYNKALEKFVAVNDSDKLSAVSPRGYLMALAKVKSTNAEIMNQSYWTKDKIEKIEDLSLLEVSQKFGYKTAINLQTWQYGNSHFYPEAENKLMEEFVMNEPIDVELKKAGDDILAKRTRLGLVNEGAARMIYSASLNNFGMYNCDRFSNRPPAMMAEIDIPFSEDAQIYFQIKGENSLLTAYRSNNGYNVRIPKNKEINIIMMSFDKNLGPLFLKESRKFTSNTKLDLKPEPFNLKEIKSALASL